MTKQKLRYVKTNFSNIMETLDNARLFTSSEQYFQGKDGDIHKVVVKYVATAAYQSGGGIFDIEVNEIEMGGNPQDYGEAYDLINSCVE